MAPAIDADPVPPHVVKHECRSYSTIALMAAGGGVRRRSEALASAEELWGAKPPRQARSVEATQRLALAGAALFAARDFDAVSVGDIAEAAGMSVGAFYTRFASKEHLVVHLMGSLAEELATLARRELSPERLAGATLADVVRRYLSLMGGAFVRHRGLLRPATLIARRSDDGQLRDLLARFNCEVHGRFRDLLLERLGNEPRERAIARIDLAILWSSAAMREVLLHGEPVSRLSRSHSALVDGLARGVVLYLEAGDAD